MVALLERKNAWSDQDLERYMSLIRSEHVNDQGVQVAKDNVAVAERALEEARTRLEKRERMQYHEEQIWSDTIRRNSTWVTFGLMGVNILLLLFTMVAIEPWRRKRMVKEIRKTLDENQAAIPQVQVLKNEMDTIAEPEITSREAKSSATHETPPSEVSPPPEISPVDDTSILRKYETVKEGIPAPQVPPTPAVDKLPTLVTLREDVKDLFSERLVTLRKVDVSAIALEGAATGAAVAALLIFLLKPK